MILRFLALASAAGTLALIATLGPPMPSASAAPARFVRCTTAPLSVSEVGHGILGVDKRVTAIAITTWQMAASQQIGTSYGNWSTALGGTVSCHRDLFKVTCVATATPCRS